MARHRRRPVSRHQARTRGENPAAAQPPNRRLGTAIRRVVVTPTFAAGLGVVVAAVLAYPMQTVFNYAAPNTARCAGGQCGPGGGEPASVPGDRLSEPGKHSTGTVPRNRNRQDQRGGQALTAAPHLSYHTASRVGGGFNGTIMIDFRPRGMHERWWLEFSYPSARILRVWAGQYIRHGPHGAVVGSWDWRGPAAHRRLVHVSIQVAGHPGPPARCFFNGRACHFGGRHTGQPPGDAGPPGHAGRPGAAHSGEPGSAPPGRRPGSAAARRHQEAGTAGQVSG
jgi:hypothetical protein